MTTRKTRCFHFGATLMAISVIGILIVFLLYNFTTSINYKYSIAIDSGSTHSRVILFRWKANKLNNTGLIEEVRSCKVESGISSFVGQKLNHVADKLIDCIQKVIRNTTTNEDLFIYLGATAGMRILNLTEPDTASKILQKIRQEFTSIGLKIRRMSIITGKEEGLFAWVAANYLSGSFFQHISYNSSHQTYGILDMGGASVQIAYEVNLAHENKNQSDIIRIKLFGRDYYVNTFSNLCFGIEQALNRYVKLVITKYPHKNAFNQIEVPCFPKNFTTSTKEFNVDNICTKLKNKTTSEHHNKHYELIGTSQIDQCQKVVDELLDRDACQKNFEICFKKALSGDKMDPFYAISAYYHVTKVLKLNKTENISRQQYLDKSKSVCSMNENQLRDELQVSSRYISSICFKLSYIISTLTNVYKFDENTWPHLKFVNDINNSYLGWIAGLMINETSLVPGENAWKSLIDTDIYFAIIVSLILILALGIRIVCQKRTNRTNSKLKTQPNTVI